MYMNNWLAIITSPGIQEYRNLFASGTITGFGVQQIRLQIYTYNSAVVLLRHIYNNFFTECTP